MSAPDHRSINSACSKRKGQTKTPNPRKKVKTWHYSVENLPWRSVTRPRDTGLYGDDGILELEEVEDVEVIYEDTDAGRVAKFNVSRNPKTLAKLAVLRNNGSVQLEVDSDVGLNPTAECQIGQSSRDADPTENVEHQPFDSMDLLPDWHTYSLHPQLLRVLHAKKFLSPTPIQAQAIPSALAGRDVVGVAETGSGKTLAYGLPILHHILSHPRRSSEKRQLRALILAPTRELALQVSSHLNECLNTVAVSADKSDTGEVSGKTNNKGKGKNAAKPQCSPKKPPLVSVAAIVGGMSEQKQRRILDRGIDVLVATPGRLWDIVEDDDSLAGEIKNLKFLVLDEADRMIEAGHFAELDNILRLTLRDNLADHIEQEVDDPFGTGVEQDTKEGITNKLQTFVFSATLSKELQRNLKKRSRPRTSKAKQNRKPASTLDELLLRLDFRDSEPEVIDISPEGGVVSSLKESKIECLSADKDVYLYYFLLRYPGRSLVFLSSIDGIRRLLPLMELLGMKAWPLHSQLEQRQRLKNLDRFKTTSSSVLLATDIAARGLDIPYVDHVIHYQIPRSADSYVHRNGRTARAMRKGFSMLMCAPNERRVVRALLGSLGRQENDISEMAVELYLIDKLKVRVQLARQVDTAQHKIKKENHERHWVKETAEAMELELDSDLMSDLENEKPLKQKRKATSARTAVLKAELKHLLTQPLIMQGVSTRYITSGSHPIVDDLITGEHNEAVLGLKNTEAGSHLLSKKVNKGNAKRGHEEWRGIGYSR